MAAYLGLKHRETGRVYFQGALLEVDEMFARAVGMEPHPVDWCLNWMDTIGQTLAIWGPDGFVQCRKRWGDVEHNGVPLVDWFERTFENV